MSKIIVTGGAGFIGSHLVDQLIELGHQVEVVDSLMLGKKDFVNSKAVFHQVDIRDYQKLEPLFKNVEAVFHLAADPRLAVSIEDPRTTHDINVTGTHNVLSAARVNHVQKVVFSSSCAVYGDQPVPLKESMIPSPLSPYGLHKLMGEEYCRLFSSLFGLNTVCLRYFNVYGPRKLATGAYPMVIPIFLNQKKTGKELTIVGDGEATRDYIHVNDVVSANIKAWQSAVVDGKAFNVGSGKQTSVNEIAKVIGGPTVNLPPRAGEMRFVEADISQTKAMLGWQPTVDFATGIELLKREWKVKE